MIVNVHIDQMVMDVARVFGKQPSHVGCQIVPAAENGSHDWRTRHHATLGVRSSYSRRVRIAASVRKEPKCFLIVEVPGDPTGGDEAGDSAVAESASSLAGWIDCRTELRPVGLERSQSSGFGPEPAVKPRGLTAHGGRLDLQQRAGAGSSANELRLVVE